MVPIFPDIDVFMMDEGDYDEHLLLNDLDDVDNKHFHLPMQSSSSSTFFRITPERTSSGGTMVVDLDDVEFFDDETAEIVDSVCHSEESYEVERTQSSSQPAVAPAPPVTPENNKNRKQPLSKKSEQEREGCEEPRRVGVPSKFDILCGQSRICAGHTGNRRFQVVLDIYAPRYDVSITKQEKMTLTKEIVSCIHAAGGRFLRYEEGVWEEISDVTARDKVSHALRTKVASWKRQQQEMGTRREESNNVIATKGSKPCHRRSSRGSRSRRTSGSSITTSASDIVATSFDGNDSTTPCVMGELLKAQQKFFKTFTESPSGEGTLHPLMK
jgi:hypothetical protein